MEKIIEICKIAKQNPYRCYDVIKDGFRFMIYWDENRKWFEASMHFSDDWPHTHYLYGRDIEELISHIDYQIKDSMKIFTHGGHCSEKYLMKNLDVKK